MSGVKRYDCTNGGASFCQGCYTMTECELGDYVSSEDYDTLRTANQRLREALELIMEMQLRGFIVLGEKATGKANAALRGNGVMYE